MNQKKSIEYCDPETGEVFKGSTIEVAKQLKVSTKTMYKLLEKVGKSSTTEPEKVQIMEKVERAAEKVQKVLNKYADLQAEHKLQMNAKPDDNDREKKILPRKPCVLCGKLTYCTKIFDKDTPQEHTIHICFASCKTPPLPSRERKEPSREQMQYLLKYIAENTKLKSNVKRGVEVE